MKHPVENNFEEFHSKTDFLLVIVPVIKEYRGFPPTMAWIIRIIFLVILYFASFPFPILLSILIYWFLFSAYFFIAVFW